MWAGFIDSGPRWTPSTPVDVSAALGIPVSGYPHNLCAKVLFQAYDETKQGGLAWPPFRPSNCGSQNCRNLQIHRV